MAYENILAEIVGGLLSGSRYAEDGWIKSCQVALTGFSLAHFVGSDIARVAVNYTEVTLSYGAVLFLVAYLGPTTLDRIHLFIKAFQVSKVWNQKK